MANCTFHAREGVEVVAHYRTSKGFACRDCMQGKPVQPAHTFTHGAPIATLPAELQQKIEARENPMPNVKNIDYVAMQNDRSDGMQISAIAKKYGCSNANVYLKTKGNGNTKPGPAAKVARLPKPSIVTRSAPEKSGSIAAAITELRARLNIIDELISKLEAFE